MAEENIKEYFEQIIRMCIKLYKKEDLALQNDIRTVAQLLGAFTDSSLYVPLMIKIIFEEETKLNPALVSNGLVRIFALSKNFRTYLDT
jgi:hypothetical protein